MIAIIIGVILIGLAVFLYYNRQNALNKSLDVRYYETSKISESSEIYKSVKAELGEGHYSGNIVEFKGIGSTEKPLLSEHTETECLYYYASVERKYEAEEETRDSEGRVSRRWVTRTETVSSNEKMKTFTLNDGSGAKVLVNPEGASIDAIDHYSEYRPEKGNRAIAETLTSAFLGGGGRTLGYTYTERIIPNNAKIYVLGELSDKETGKLTVKRPSEAGKTFIVSVKSEEQIVEDANSSAAWQLYGGIASAVIGVIAIILGALKIV